VWESFAIGCRLWPEDLHLGVDNKPDCSALFLHLAQDADFGLRIFIWVWTTSLMVVQYFFTWLRQKKAYINGGSIADKVNIARNYFEKEVSVGAVFVMDSRVSQADRAWHPKEAFGVVFVMDSRVSQADRAWHPKEAFGAVFVMDSRVSPADRA